MTMKALARYVRMTAANLVIIDAKITSANECFEKLKKASLQNIEWHLFVSAANVQL